MFDIHQKVFDEYGERKEGAAADYIDGLMEEFANSSEAKPLFDADEGVSYTAMMIEYALDYCGTTPATMSVRDFEEVVFELFPRKVSVEPERAPVIVTELRAFWQFVDRQYGLPNARAILARLGDKAAGRLQKELANPANYGMAKSFFMQGLDAGFDMTTEKGINNWMNEYNSRIAGRHGTLPPLPPLPPLSDADLENLLLLGEVEHDTRAEREARRKARKRQRQARKKGRR